MSLSILILNNRSKASDISILKMIAVLSFTTHVIIAFKIACQKRKCQVEDNRVYIIHLPPNSCPIVSVSDGNAAINHASPINTRRYNPIFYQLGAIIYIVITLGVFFVSLIFQRVWDNHLSQYAMNFLPGTMIYTIFPVIFYVRNPKATKFIVSCLVSR